MNDDVVKNVPIKFLSQLLKFNKMLIVEIFDGIPLRLRCTIFKLSHIVHFQCFTCIIVQSILYFFNLKFTNFAFIQKFEH